MRDRDLVRLYWPAQLRPAFDALFAIDDAMADVVASSTQPALGAIRLAWWREALERLDTSPPPPEPRLQAVAAELLPRGISGAEVAELEAGWRTLLDEWPELELINRRGATLFELAAGLLKANCGGLADAGALYATMNVERRGIAHGASMALGLYGLRFPRKVRPVTMLAALAARDLSQSRGPMEAEATPGRAVALLRHRLTGRIS